MLTLGEIAEALSLEFRGASDVPLTGLASLDLAGPQHLSFVSSKKYLRQLDSTGAGAAIIHPDWLDHWSGPSLFCDQPYLAYARATALFDDRPLPAGSIHASAVVDESVSMGANVTVDAGAVIEQGVVLGDNVWVGANVYIGHDCRIGAGTRLHPGTALYYGVLIGEHCTIHANAIIGADGFGFAPSSEGWVKIVQLGTVVVGDHVEIGAGATIDRGALTDTVLADKVILDNQVHIAHNVRVGERTGIAACTGIAGSTTIGADCTFAGMVGVGDHLEIADNVHVNGQGRVSKSLLEPGSYASGTSIQPYRDWSKNAVRFEQLAEMAKRLTALEKQLTQLAGATPEKGDPT